MSAESGGRAVSRSKSVVAFYMLRGLAAGALLGPLVFVVVEWGSILFRGYNFGLGGQGGFLVLILVAESAAQGLVCGVLIGFMGSIAAVTGRVLLRDVNAAGRTALVAVIGGVTAGAVSLLITFMLEQRSIAPVWLHCVVVILVAGFTAARIERRWASTSN